MSIMDNSRAELGHPHSNDSRLVTIARIIQIYRYEDRKSGNCYKRLCSNTSLWSVIYCIHAVRPIPHSLHRHRPSNLLSDKWNLTSIICLLNELHFHLPLKWLICRTGCHSVKCILRYKQLISFRTRKELATFCHSYWRLKIRCLYFCTGNFIALIKAYITYE